MFWKILLALFVAFVVLNVLLLVLQNNRRPALGVQADGKLAPLPNKPNCVSSFVDGDKAVDPLPMAEDLSKTIALIEQSLAKLGNVQVIEKDGHYVRALATTKLMRYKDDIELLVDTDSKLVHFRSSSRAGYSDMGVNKARYDEFAKHYEEAVQ